MSFRPSPRHHLAELLLSSTHPNADGPTGPLCARPATQRDGRRKDSRNNRNSLAIPSIKRAAVGGRGGNRMRTAAANHAGASGPGVPRDLKQPYVRMYVRRGRRFSSKPPNQGTPAKLGEASGRRPLRIPTTSTRGGGENVFFFSFLKKRHYTVHQRNLLLIYSTYNVTGAQNGMRRNGYGQLSTLGNAGQGRNFSLWETVVSCIIYPKSQSNCVSCECLSYVCEQR